MSSLEFLEEMLIETKKWVPAWLYASLSKAARARAGGRAAHREDSPNFFEKTSLTKLTSEDLEDMPDNELGEVWDLLNLWQAGAKRKKKDNPKVINMARMILPLMRKRKMKIKSSDLSKLTTEDKACDEHKEDKKVIKAKWTTAFINDLPDSAFLYIEPGGEKDEDKKTKPRSLRHLPYRDPTGKVDLPHLRNALARLSQSKAPGLDEAKVRARAERILEEEKEKRVSKARIAFVSGSMNQLERARREPLVGPMGEIFKDKYLKPLDLNRQDVCITTLKSARRDLDYINPKVIVALGREPFVSLGNLVDEVLPHPEAIRKHGDSGEVSRKLKRVKKLLVDNYNENLYYRVRNQRPKKGPIVEYLAEVTSVNPVQITKAHDDKRIVYGIVLDPYGSKGPEADAHNDWMPPAQVEKTAHEYLKRSRVIGLEHIKKTESKVVESFIEQYPSRKEYLKAMSGEDHIVTKRKFGDDFIHSGSWVLGVELDENGWDLFKSGKINAFSPGGYGVRKPLKKSEMPKVTFTELVEKSE